MLAEESFGDLLMRVRAGDGEAAAELLRRYEPTIRRLVRLKLTDQRLGRLLDSMDICQSVMANFFVRAAAGQFELNSPEDLLKLLTTMARNKLLTQVDRHQADCRDLRRQEAAGDEVLGGIAGRQETPSQIVAGEEMLRRARELLSEDERRIAERRALGQDWAEIAEELGSTAEAVRKKLTRAMDRVAQQLGFDTPD